MPRLYHYVGPAAIKARVAGQPAGTRIRSASDLLASARGADQEGELVAATFVVDEAGDLRVTERRSEHVACAGGKPVRTAGELFLLLDGDTVEVAEITNQSTGYCPEPESWPAVAAVLDLIGVKHPGRFTQEITFRRCAKCGQRNIIRDGWFVCGVCGAELPAGWNFNASGDEE